MKGSPEEAQILEEIRQIKSQFATEVHRSRHAWPESLKKRTVLLHGLGLKAKDISQRTGISYFTLMNWLPRCRDRGKVLRSRGELQKGEFKALAVRENPKTATVTVAHENEQPVDGHHPRNPGRLPLTVTVTLPGGARIDGVTPEFLTAWLGSDGQP